MACTIRTIRRTIRAAHTTSPATGYRTLSGRIATDVAAGRLIRTGDYLNQAGGADLPDGQQAWYGRHVKKAHLAATGRTPLKVWAQHRTTGRWIHVHVYQPHDPALQTALGTYKATRHLAAPTLQLAA